MLKYSNGSSFHLKWKLSWTSLVIQWLRIYLPMQETGFDPWSGKIPHALEQLSLCTTTAEAHRPRAHALQHRSPCNEKPRQHNEA